MSSEISIVGKITSAISSSGDFLKSALNTVKEIQKIKEDYAVKEKIYELLDKLYIAKHQVMDLQDLLQEAKNYITELDNKIGRASNWDNDKNNYEVYLPQNSTVVYRFKISEDSNDNPHYLCPKCFEENKKCIIQHSATRKGYILMSCSTCDSGYRFPRNFFDS